MAAQKNKLSPKLKLSKQIKINRSSTTERNFTRTSPMESDEKSASLEAEIAEELDLFLESGVLDGSDSGGEGVKGGVQGGAEGVGVEGAEEEGAEEEDEEDDEEEEDEYEQELEYHRPPIRKSHDSDPDSVESDSDDATTSSHQKPRALDAEWELDPELYGLRRSGRAKGDARGSRVHGSNQGYTEGYYNHQGSNHGSTSDSASDSDDFGASGNVRKRSQNSKPRRRIRRRAF